MVILDFYGMPGSGKSTISHMLAERLRNDGYTVIEPSWILDSNDSTFKRYGKKTLLALFYQLNHPTVVIKAMKNNKGNSFIQSLKLWLNLSYTMYYLTKKRAVDFLIMDEGIAQGVVSLVTECVNTKTDECYSMLRKKIKFDLIEIYVRISVETALKRLNLRGTTYSRVDRIDESKKEAYLSSILSICDDLKVEKSLVCENEDVNFNVEKLFKAVI